MRKSRERHTTAVLARTIATPEPLRRPKCYFLPAGAALLDPSYLINRTVR